MAAIGLTTLALLSLQSLDSTRSQPEPPLPLGQCSDVGREAAHKAMPRCIPRPTLVTVPGPLDPSLLQVTTQDIHLGHLLKVIPSQVVVNRCQGSCHSPGQAQYQKCVPGTITNTSFPVMYERLGNDSIEEVCSTIQLVTHLDCRCGCPEAKCAQHQIFDERTCECRCRDQRARGQCLVQYNKEWDPYSCSCRCRPEEYKECNTGYSYEGEYSCECLPHPPLRAETPLLVTLSVLVILLLIICISFYVMLKRTKEKLLKVSMEGQAEKLFPSHERTI